MESREIRDLIESYYSVYNQDLNETMMPTPLPSKDPVKMQKPQPQPKPVRTPIGRGPLGKPGTKGDRGPVIKSMGEQSMFDIVKGHLLDEGYADTEQAALAIMTNMSEEWKQSIVEEVLDEELTGERAERARKLMAAARPYGRRRASTDERYRALNRVLKAKEGSIPPGRQPEHNIRGDEKLPTKRGGSGIKGRAKTYTDAGPTPSGRGNRATRRGGGTVDDTRYDESFDLFGTILEYLVAEGYADTNKSALAIMANMSEDWKQSICEELLNEVGTNLYRPDKPKPTTTIFQRDLSDQIKNRPRNYEGGSYAQKLKDA